MTATKKLPAISKWCRNSRTGSRSLSRTGVGVLELIQRPDTGSKWRVELTPMKPGAPEVGNSLGRMQCLGLADSLVAAYDLATAHYALSAFRTSPSEGSQPLHAAERLAAHHDQMQARAYGYA